MSTFSRPPIVEVVLGVQFDRADRGVVHLGRYSERVRATYPDVVEAPALSRVIEAPDDGLFLSQSIQFFGPSGPTPRIQMYDKTRRKFIQLQTDRFHANWQRCEPGDQYPRFEEVWRCFSEGWNEWKAYCGDAAPAPVQYEITYINHVFAGELWTPALGVSNVLSWMRVPPAEKAPEIESALHYWIPECKGRLHVIGRTARKLPENIPAIALELTLRGGNEHPGKDDDMKSWMDTAHERIVRTFVELTSASAHKAWGLKGSETA